MKPTAVSKNSVPTPFFLLIADLLSSQMDNGVNLEASKHFPGDARSNFIRVQTIWDLFRHRGWPNIGPTATHPATFPDCGRKKKQKTILSTSE